MKTLNRILVVALYAVLMTSCSENGLMSVGDIEGLDAMSNTSSSLMEVNGSESGEVDLIAGKNDVVGKVSVTNDGTQICVSYTLDQNALDDGWLIYETHLAIAGDLEDIPTNRPGNPVPGQFPYGDDELEGVEEWTFCVAFNDLNVDCDDQVYVAAHAVVKKVGYSDVEETLYLSDGGNEGQKGLYSVELSADGSLVELLSSFDGVANFDFVTHIGASPDGETVYVVGEDSGHLGTYSVTDGSFTDLGAIDGYPGDVTQVAVSPDGILYMVSKTTDGLYTVDIATLNATWISDINIDVQGADIAFGDDGTLYLYSAGNLENLYTVDIGTGTATLVGETGVKITGLAIRDGGAGDLVGSDAANNEFIIIDKSDGSVVERILMKTESSDFVHTWGDMTVGELGEAIYLEETAWGDGERFVDRGNWGMYFEYVITCEPCVTTPTIYGITGTGGEGGLYAIEIVNGSFGSEELLFPYADISGDKYSGNGLAYDSDNNRLYFAAGSGSSGWKLYFYDFEGNIVEAASGLPGPVYGATWGAGKYWFIQNGTDEMYTVSFNSEGTAGAVELFESNIASGKNFTFGDIAFDGAKTVYGSTSSSGGDFEFFMYDLSKGAGDRYTLVTNTGDARGLQLGFAGDENLYGINTGSKDWFKVSVGDGSVELLGTGINGYNDLSTGPSFCVSDN